MMFVYKPAKRKQWYGRYRLDGDAGPTSVALRTTDKRVATEKLAKRVKDEERARVGIVPAADCRNAHAKPLADHIDAFAEHLRGAQRDGMYAYNAGKQLHRLARECGWSYLKDVTASSFEVWRAKASHAKTGKPLNRKTKNEYLAWVKNLYGWLGVTVVGVCPLVDVKNISARGQDKKRRAFTDTEMAATLSHAGEFSLAMYAASVLGLRRGELEQLVWGDIHLHADPPCIDLRASTTKSGRAARVQLSDELVKELSRHRPADADEAAKVFPCGLPKMKQFRKILQKAGVVEIDAGGKKLVVHSLRHTFCTLLHRQGLTEAGVMIAMRVTDRKLVDRTYLDPTLLAKRLSEGFVPWSIPERSPRRSPALVFPGHSVSIAVTGDEREDDEKSSKNAGESHDLSRRGTCGRSSVESWGTRIRT